ncbi:MAG: hypothetical protein R3E83_26250 [Burkholderiaceae bacterium]
MIPTTLLTLPEPLNERMRSLIEDGAPYRSIAAVHREPRRPSCAAWFRNFWALGGQERLPGADAVFRSPALLELVREASGATIIEPLAMMTNLNPPAPAAPVHLDLPFYRGAHRREVPSWLLAPMGYSGLFERWSIPVVSALIWFYRGEGGAFEYWPHGLGGPSQQITDTGGGRALIAENETLFHRVAQIGRPERFLPGNQVPYDALLERRTDGWSITDDGRHLADYGDDEVRISVLWKAYVFANAREAALAAGDDDKLSPQQIVSIFQADLLRRGHVIDPPASLAGDDLWAETIRQTYAAPSAPTAGS